jgi:hypothetical protein
MFDDAPAFASRNSIDDLPGRTLVLGAPRLACNWIMVQNDLWLRSAENVLGRERSVEAHGSVLKVNYARRKIGKRRASRGWLWICSGKGQQAAEEQEKDGQGPISSHDMKER